ncbi:FAD-linked sulfhydryl oxidase ERV1, putative [Plasmodium ovale]|uniref:Sulfhydryl oxidase n=2 Tax=Plasmodium ovale TaxID=36330 RepID=A0A1A8VJF0_PLAOA|nr:FAD-linked sulfhydryl oxidase ERV1, putative (ERV1) [Plasmodium ovale curtisi]SBS86150.1 FAD-linked sulfhydryl oxidase ERV1, putative (ERV1) [Plasmodium ovale curtisi]SCA48204.1 FAD-linked sulfhydryl oxidase ERV1, putative [Plasmodium ovale]
MNIEKCNEKSCADRERIKFNEGSKDGNRKTIYPPDRAEIGRASWLILHTISANYPNEPTEEEKKKHSKFFYAFSNLYPCHICKLDLYDILRNYKLNCDNKVSFSTFVFNLHNMVNEEIGKDLFPCDDIRSIIDMYKTVG